MNKFPFLLVALLLTACVRSPSPVEPEEEPRDTVPTTKPIVTVDPYDSLRKPDAVGEFKDPRDGHVYHWVQVGGYRIFAENLASVPKHGKTSIYTTSTLDSAASLAKYGRAYDYEAMIDSTKIPDYEINLQGACPEGWWIPGPTNWDVVTWRALNAGYKTDSIFNDWAFAKEEGGSNTLGLNFLSTHGTDYDCDTAEFFADSISNCRENVRQVVAYATVDTTSNRADVYDRIISAPYNKGRYNVYKMFYKRNISSGTVRTTLTYGNSVIRRNLEDFSYIRCFQSKDGAK